jgi:hypothetical protein
MNLEPHLVINYQFIIQWPFLYRMGSEKKLLMKDIIVLLYWTNELSAVSIDIMFWNNSLFVLLYFTIETKQEIIKIF